MKTILTFCLGSLLLLGPALAVAVPARHATVPPAVMAKVQQLDLTPAQRAELVELLIRAQALHVTVQADVDAYLGDAKRELARADGDLRTLASQRETLVELRIANARELRDELLNFYYEDLSPQQQATMRGFLLQRIARIERVRAAFATLRANFVGV